MATSEAAAVPPLSPVGAVTLCVVVPNVRRGEDPFTDVLAWGEEVFTPEIDGLIREIAEIGETIYPGERLRMFEELPDDLEMHVVRHRDDESRWDELHQTLREIRDRGLDRIRQSQRGS